MASTFEAVPPEVMIPEPLTGIPIKSASQSKRCSSTSVPEGDWSQESMDWLEAAMASSVTTAGTRVGGCRWATQAGSLGTTPCDHTVCPSSWRTSVSSRPVSGQISVDQISSCRAAGVRFERGPRGRARLSTAQVAAETSVESPRSSTVTTKSRQFGFNARKRVRPRRSVGPGLR